MLATHVTFQPFSKLPAQPRLQRMAVVAVSSAGVELSSQQTIEEDVDCVNQISSSPIIGNPERGGSFNQGKHQIKEKEIQEAEECIKA